MAIKLNDYDVGLIRLHLFSNNKSIQEVATLFNVKETTVSRIYNSQSHQDTFTRFVDGLPVTQKIDPPGKKGQFNKWLNRKARRLKISFEAVLRLVTESGGKCQICGTQLVLGPQVRRPYGRTLLCLDHNHKTGNVRGVLCSPCNLRIGKYETPLGKKIIDYLR